MNVAYLMQDRGRIYGAERATLDLASALHGHDGMTVRVYLLDETRLALPGSEVKNAFVQGGIPVESLSVDRAFSPGLVARIRDAMRGAGRDVLHTVGYKADVHGGWATRWGKACPWVSTVHGWLFRPDVKERFYGHLNLLALRRCTRVVALSRYYETFLRQRGVTQDCLTRIPSGYVAPDALPLRSPRSPAVIGMLGRLSEEKNHVLFIHALAHLKQSGRAVRALIAGDGPEHQRIQATIDAAGLREDVELAGYLPTETFFRRVDVMVLCSRMENLPYSVMEAMARGVPPIATAVGGLPDLIEEDRTGYLVEPGDAVALADRIGRLADDEALRTRLGEAGLRKLRQEFSVEAMRDAHMALYRTLMQERTS